MGLVMAPSLTGQVSTEVSVEEELDDLEEASEGGEGSVHDEDESQEQGKDKSTYVYFVLYSLMRISRSQFWQLRILL